MENKLYIYMHKTRWWVRISGMELKINTSREKKSAILSALVWGLAWTVPWGNILVFDGNLAIVFLVDMFKLGLSITLFIVPGILLYILLESKENVTEAINSHQAKTRKATRQNTILR